MSFLSEQIEIQKKRLVLEREFKKTHNTGKQIYKNYRLDLLFKLGYKYKKAKCFQVNRCNQRIWIPNCYLEKDGTIKQNVDIDFCFKNSKLYYSRR